MANQNDPTGPKDIAQEKEKAPNIFERVESHVQSRTLQGFVALIPLLITVILLAFLIGKADGYIRSLPFVENQPWDFPGVGLISLVVIFYFIGWLDSTRFGHKVLQFKDEVLSRVPLVKTFYKITQQGITSLTSSATFTRVVFVEWPREGMVALGFVTGRVFTPDRTQSLAVVYIPTVPNPTSGNMAFIHEDDVMETDITVDTAMRLVFSGGIVLPEKLVLARAPQERVTQGSMLVGQYEASTRR